MDKTNKINKIGAIKKTQTTEKSAFKIDRGAVNATSKSESAWLDRDSSSVIYTTRNKEFLPWGKKNDQPYYHENLTEICEEHSAMVKGYVSYIIGQGFDTEDKTDDFMSFYKNDPEEKGKFRSLSLHKIQKLIANDMKIHGGAFLQVIWSRDGKTIAKIEHQPLRDVRKMSDDSGYFISKKWNQTYGRLPDDAIPLQRFDEEIGDKEQPQLLEIRMPWNASYDYSSPDYISSHLRIALDRELAIMNLSFSQKGFLPSTIISLPFTPPEEERDAAKSQLKEAFGGAENAGEPLLLWGSEGIEVNSFAPESPDKLYSFQQELIANKVRAAHRVTRPELFGLTIYASGGLNLNHSKDELLLAFELFTRTVIEPYHSEIEEAFKRLAVINGIDEDEIKIIPFQLYADVVSDAQDNAQDIADQGEEKADIAREDKTIVEPKI